MIVQYSGYNKPIVNNMCIGMCFFNPVGYKKPLENINIIIQEYTKYKIPFYIIELLYPGQKPCIPNAFTVYSNSVLFSKENLWNILEKFIPDTYDKIIFMDSDLLFTDPDWFNQSYELLINNDIIQCMEFTYKDIFTKEQLIDLDFSKLTAPQVKTAFAKAIVQGDPIDLKYHHPGFTLGIDRNFFHSIGGLFEYCITGSGDLAFWGAFIPEYKLEAHHLHANAMEKYVRYKHNAYKNYIYQKRINYLSNCMTLHLYHGHQNNRQYNDRQKYLPIACDYYHNEYGVLELANTIIDNENQLINYWLKRKEDD